MSEKVRSLFSSVLENLGRKGNAINEEEILGRDRGYAEFESIVARQVAENTSGPLFTTDASGLFEGYLAGIPEEYRRHYDCRCCRRFIERYGGLVTIDLGGNAHPFLWDWFRDDEYDASFFGQSAMNLTQCIIRTVPNGQPIKPARVTGVFLSGEEIWGTPLNTVGDGKRRDPVTGNLVQSKYVGQTWTHLHGRPVKPFKHPTLNAEQAMAEKKQDWIQLKKGFSEAGSVYTVENLTQAVRILEADALDRSEKTLRMAKWLLGLLTKVKNGIKRDNLLWLAVATAPLGFCHLGSTMIRTLKTT